MYKNYIIGVFLSFLFLISQNTYSQVEPCKTNTVHQEMLAADPNYKATFEKMQADLQRHIAEKMANSATNRTEATVYTVPVVVHVIHTGGAVNTAYNPSDANINAMLNKINTDFRNTTFGADAEINFVLAQRDPNCNATTGINRVNGSGLANYVAGGVGTGGAADADVKALSRWPNTDYYNIWVVNKIDGNDGTSGSFTAGYAYFPGASAAVDGTVILASQTNGTSETMTHELGHAFALQHTFHKAETGDDSANGTDCPLNTDCTTQGDLICDTDPHAYMLGAACNTGNCSGVSAATLANYMSYCNGTDRFTPNQVTRMRTALETQRGGLITSLGGTAPVTAPTTACTPTNTGSFSAAGITRFVLNNLNVSSQSSQFEGTNYVNRVCGQGTTLNAGSSHSITIETSINVHNVKVYVDYNNDGDFIDTGEEIASGITPNTVGTKSFTATYNVPNSGVLFNQPLRLRAVASLIGDGVATSCEVFRGQAEDYALTIQSVATPTVSLSVSTNAGSETATTAVTVTATSSSAVSGAQTVDLAVTGTNITAGDYTLSSGTITIANGATTGTATFTVVDDALVEGTETAILTISNPSAGMTLGTPVTQNVVITDNDALPTVSLSVSTNAGTEAATTAVTVTATSSSAVSGAQTVDLAVTGTNITAGDYTLSSGTITIANGATTGTATFTVVDDALVEGTETAILTISNPSAGMTLGTPVTQNVVITDNDALPTVSLSVSTNAGTEAATTAVTVTATSSSAVSGAQTVDLAVTGTNITAGDYTLSSGTITIANGATTGTATFTVVDDALVEGTETAILTISNPSAGMTLGTPVTQNVVITDNDALPTVSLSVSTNAGTEAATTAVTVTATSSSAVSGAQTVDLAVTGTNITAGDYTLSSGTITIANGATTGTATFTVVDDALVEGTETAILTISNPSAGMTLGTPVTQNVVITDNDALPTVSLSVSTNAGTEAATTAVTVTATSSSAVSGAQTVDLAVTGTNITAGDYTLSSGTITIANGATTGTATFTVVDDALVEGTETAILTISNPSAGMTLGTPVTQNVVITDNDSATGNITNVNQTTFYSTIQAAVDAANDGETLKILVNNTYAENVTITNKSLTFTSDATDYTQITVKQIIFNGTGKTLTISTHMGISEILNMQEGNVVVTGGNDFALRSTSTGTALIINDDANTVVGNVIMERFIPASSTIPGFGGTGQDGLGYRLFSSPFSDATISQFGDDMAAGLVLNTAYNTAPEPAFVRPFPTFFQYEETNNGATTSAYYNPFISNYKVPTTPNLTVARGYQANIATGVTVDLNGTLNNGNQSIAVTNSGGAGYNLIGNPYPSPISWTALHGFGTNNTFLNSEVQFDIPIGQYEGSFASYTAAGVSNNGGKDSIACMQGFFVRTAVGGTVTMNNTVRWDTDTRFFKTQATKGAKDGLVRVALRKDGIMDETTIYFQEGATPAYDASFDAGKLHKINSKYSTLYSYNENVEAGKEEYFSINGLGSFDTEQKLPLAMNIVTDGEYEITLRDMKYFHSKHDVYLYDSLTDSLHNLRVEGDYKFVSTKGTEIKRFVLLFKTDANADFFENERVMVYPNPTPNEFSYSLKTAREGNYTIRLFDATGRIILEENKIKEGAFLEGTINLEKHASGLYLLQVSDAEKTTTVRVVKE